MSSNISLKELQELQQAYQQVYEDIVDEGFLDKVKSAVGLKKKADEVIKDVKKKPSGTINLDKADKLRKDKSGHNWKTDAKPTSSRDRPVKDNPLKYVPKKPDKSAKWKEGGKGSDQMKSPGADTERRSNVKTSYQRPAKDTGKDQGLTTDAKARRKAKDSKKEFEYSSHKTNVAGRQNVQSDPGGNKEFKSQADSDIRRAGIHGKPGKTDSDSMKRAAAVKYAKDNKKRSSYSEPNVNQTKGGPVKTTKIKSSTGSTSISAVDKLKAKKDRGYTKIGEERNETFHELIDVMIQQGFPIEEMVIEMYNNLK